MGIVREIRDAFNTQIESILPSYSRSKYKWSFADNNKPNSKSIYAVRIGSAGTISGTNQTITQERLFEVLLSNRFESKGDNDNDLDEKIIQLIDDHEALQVELYRRKLNISRVLVINAIDITEPEIDNENNIVTMTATYTVRFRLGV